MKKRGIRTILALFLAVSLIMSMTITASAASGTYYGKTSSGKKVYYTTSTSYKSYRLEKDSSKLSTSQINKYAKGTVDLAFCFADITYSVPYTMLCSLIGIASKGDIRIKQGTYFHNYANINSKTTRTFFIYTDKAEKNKRTVYKDECANADLHFSIHPVGKGLKDKELRAYYGKTLKADHYSDKNYILNRCQINYNHKGVESWPIDSKILHISLK